MAFNSRKVSTKDLGLFSGFKIEGFFFFTILEERFENEISQFVQREAFNSGAFSTKDL